MSLEKYLVLGVEPSNTYTHIISQLNDLNPWGVVTSPLFIFMLQWWPLQHVLLRCVGGVESASWVLEVRFLRGREVWVTHATSAAPLCGWEQYCLSLCRDGAMFHQ